MKILMVAHGHPEISKGGAEVAAYNLCAGLRDQGHDVLFLARTGEPAHGGSIFSTRRDGELLFHTGMADFFNFRARDGQHVWRAFRDLLRRFRPDVIHFHHYIHMGVELLREARTSCPDASIVLTLHEYLALCYHQGQMVKRPGLELCYRSSPADCARCFPDHSPSDFFLREQFLKSAFLAVDAFIAPSHFLAKRYVEWGLPAERIHVLENGQRRVEAPPPRPLAEGERRGRFAFFGQANPYKGLDVLLAAVDLLPRSVRKQVHLALHAANLTKQEAGFQAKIKELSEKLGTTLTFHGPYESQDLGALMSATDWVVLPSIWWENSPMVIQEAFAHGRPVICSDIGGTAEKVRDGVDGLHFRARDVPSLAKTIERALDPALFDRLCQGIQRPPWTDESATSHLVLYEGAQRSQRRSPLRLALHAG